MILTDDEKYESNLKHISENALTFIKLYGLIFNQGSSVTCTLVLQNSNQKTKLAKLAVSSSHLIRTLRYFSNDSVEQVKPLFDQVNNCIQKFKSLEVALDYWALAKEQQFKTGKDEPIQFLNAMISLESLLGERTQIRYKISIRLALLLQLIGYSALEVFENTKKFYDKRSQLIHGGFTINDTTKINSQDIRTILKYCRDCILWCIALTKRLHK